MKLADSEHLEEKEYLMLQDPWRQEWEKGVQVPVALDSIPDLSVRYVWKTQTWVKECGWEIQYLSNHIMSMKGVCGVHCFATFLK